MLDKNISKKGDLRDLNAYTNEVSEQTLCRNARCDGKMYRILIQLFRTPAEPRPHATPDSSRLNSNRRRVVVVRFLWKRASRMYTVTKEPTA